GERQEARLLERAPAFGELAFPTDEARALGRKVVRTPAFAARFRRGPRLGQSQRLGEARRGRVPIRGRLGERLLDGGREGRRQAWSQIRHRTGGRGQMLVGQAL